MPATANKRKYVAVYEKIDDGWTDLDKQLRPRT